MEDHRDADFPAFSLMQLRGRVFRIGHLGDLNEVMCLGAIAGAEMSMRDAGIPIEPGSGAAAAEEAYRSAAVSPSFSR